MWKTWTGGPEASPISSPKSGGAVGGIGGWHPTIIGLGLLVLLEIVAVGFLSRTLLR